MQHYRNIYEYAKEKTTKWICRYIFVSLLVHVSNGDYLSSYIIAESVNRAGVDEAVSHPNPCLYHLLDLPQHLTSRKKRTDRKEIEK